MGIHTWSGASRRGRRMSLELPFNGSMPLMLQSPEFMQRHSDFFHPYPPAHLLGRMQQSMVMEQQKLEQHKLEREAPSTSQIMNLANKYMNSNGLTGHKHSEDRQSYSSNPPSPDSDKPPMSPNDDMESPRRNGDREHSSPIRSGSEDLSPRIWKMHYESKAVNRSKVKTEDQKPAVEELTA